MSVGLGPGVRKAEGWSCGGMGEVLGVKDADRADKRSAAEDVEVLMDDVEVAVKGTDFHISAGQVRCRT